MSKHHKPLKEDGSTVVSVGGAMQGEPPGPSTPPKKNKMTLKKLKDTCSAK